MTVVETHPPAPPAEERRRWTYDELLAERPVTNQPQELWDGELIMSPSPSFFHQEIIDRFHDALKTHVRARRLGKTVTSPMDMVLTPHLVTQPDVLFISNERAGIIQDRVRGAADLAAEVLSPGSRRRDRIDKRDLYEQHGVREYWLIDPDAETVEVFHLAGPQYTLAGRWRAGETAVSQLLPGFTVAVKWLFSGEE